MTHTWKLHDIFIDQIMLCDTFHMFHKASGKDFSIDGCFLEMLGLCTICWESVNLDLVKQ